MIVDGTFFQVTRARLHIWTLALSDFNARDSAGFVQYQLLPFPVLEGRYDQLEPSIIGMSLRAGLVTLSQGFLRYSTKLPTGLTLHPEIWVFFWTLLDRKLPESESSHYCTADLHMRRRPF
jgi:hypothetical protein